MNIGKYTIANTRNPKDSSLHRLRIRDNTGKMLAEVFPAKLDPDRIGASDPLKLCRQYPQSKSCLSLIKQLKINGVSLKDIEMILALPERKQKESENK